MHHVVLLFKFTENYKSQVWEDFESVQDCCRHLCERYERWLQIKNPELKELTYDISDLYDYIDSLENLNVLICYGGTATYVSKDKGWIKMKLYHSLRKDAGLEE